MEASSTQHNATIYKNKSYRQRRRPVKWNVRTLPVMNTWVTKVTKDFVILDINEIKTIDKCYLQDVIRSCHVGDLIKCPDPLPKKETNKLPPRIQTNTTLDLSIFKYKKCIRDVEQQLLEWTILRQSSIKPDHHLNMKDDFVSVTDMTFKFTTIIRDGLEGKIIFKDEDSKGGYRVLYITEKTYEEVKNEISKIYIASECKGIRQLTSCEKSTYSDKEFRTSKNFFELFFADRIKGESFCNMEKNAQKFPFELEVVTNDKPIVQVRWLPHPIQPEANIRVRGDVPTRAIEILKDCELIIDVNTAKDNGFNPVECSLHIRFHKSNLKKNPKLFNEEQLSHIIRTLLQVNDIQLLSIDFYRYNDNLKLTEADIYFYLNQRIGRCAINYGLWTENVPCTDEEWEEYLGNEPLPWKCTFLPYNSQDRAAERIVEFEFDDDKYGEGVIEYIYQHDGSEFFQFHSCKSTNQKIVFQGYHRFKIFIPTEIRLVCDREIRELETEMNNTQKTNTRWWRIRDICDNWMTVEGWPKTSIAVYYEKLKEILKGETVECGGEDKKKQLLHGCGLQLVNMLQKEYKNEVVISIDRVHEKIQLFGDRVFINVIIQRLDDFVRNPHSFSISAEIYIEMPRNLSIMKSVLDHNGEDRLSRILGGCSIRFEAPSVLHFKGSVVQYNELKKLIDTTQYHVIDRYGEKALNSRGREKTMEFSTCPICNYPYSYDKFHLSCRHGYCLQCVAHLVRHGIQDNSGLAKCLRCDKIISINDIMSLLFDERSIKFKSFFPERLSLLVKAAARNAAKDSDLICCIKNDCDAFMKKPRSGDNRKAVDCPKCDTRRCPTCPNPPHSNRTCEEERTLREDDHASFEFFLKRQRDTVKMCPKCGVPIQKTVGCNHVECVLCHIHFCWTCQFQSINHRDIYKHMQDEHGTSGGGLDLYENMLALEFDDIGDDGLPPIPDDSDFDDDDWF